MKIHTSKFKSAINKNGRELNAIIKYTINNEEKILTGDDIYSITPVFRADILKSVMKELSINSIYQIPKGTIVNLKFGVRVENNYEYLEFGNYIVFDNTYNADTKSYSHTCYDKMLYSMKDYEDLGITYPISIRNYINTICNKLGISFANKNFRFANYNRMIEKELYLDLGYTYRDVLDELAQVTASTICINSNDELEIRYISETDEIINEDFLKDKNVTIKEKYGPVNSIVLSRSAETDNIYLKNESSIDENGLCEIKIKDNQIMNWNDRDEYLSDIYAKLNGLEYYTNDFDSPGICYFDVCDRYKISIDSVEYSCLMLNDEIKINSGLYETIYTNIPNQSETDYSKADKTDRRLKQTYLIVDKQGQRIDSVVNDISEHNKQITQISQTVDTIQQQVSGEYGMDREVIGTNQVFIEDAMKYYPLELKIMGYSDLSGLIYPSANLYPSATLYPRSYHEPALNTETTVQTETQNTSQSVQGTQKIIVGPTVITATTTKEPSTQTSGNVKVTVTVNKSVEPEPLKATGWTLSDNNTVLKKTFSENTTEVLHLIDASDSSKTKDYTIVIDNIIPAYLTLCVDSQDREHPTENLKEYKIVIDKPLRSLGTTKDEISIVLEKGELKALITRYLKYTGSQIVKLDNPTTESITCPKIELLEHSNYVYIKEQPNYQVYIKYLMYSRFNEFYATRVELETTRKQTEDSIIDTVSATYSTKDELAQEKSERIQTATEISDTVSQLSETSENLSTKIKQTATNVEITATDNQTSAGITIKLKNADGTELDSQTANVSISGLVKFTDLSGNGSTVINGSNITTGTISADRVTGGTLKGTIIEGNTIKGGTISGTTINTDKDLTVGNNAYIGQNQSGTAIDTKNIFLSENSKITRTRVGNSEAIFLNGKDFAGIRTDGTELQLGQTGIQMKVPSLLGDMAQAFYVTQDNFGIQNGNFDCYIMGGNGSISMSHSPSISSDKRLKKSIKNIDVTWIDNLKVKEFEYKNTPDKKQIGLIAQDYVDTDYSKYFLNQNADGYYGINYGNITNALIQYCQELKKEIVDLRKEIEVLKSER